MSYRETSKGTVALVEAATRETLVYAHLEGVVIVRAGRVSVPA
jgi:hypothetical protein